ncbi:unnamed protein product, partial [marine sediment metagenome]
MTGEIGQTNGTDTNWGVGYYGNGWYRAYSHNDFDGPFPTTYDQTLEFSISEQDGVDIVSQDGVRGVYIWGGQNDIRTNVASYSRTEDDPNDKWPPVNNSTISLIVNDLVRRAGLTDEDIDIPSLDSFRLKHPESVGLYLTGNETFKQALDMLLGSLGAFWGFNREGKLTIGQLV